MQSKEKNSNAAIPKVKTTTSTHIVTAEAVQAEEVPTIPLGSLQTISALQPEVSVHSVASTRSVSVPVPLVVQPSEYRRSQGEWLRVWWDGIRPAYFFLSLSPFILGSVLAWTHSITSKTPLGHFRLNHFLATLAALFLIQVGAHLLNDYYDYIHGVDTSNPFGPGGLIQQGLIKPTNVLTYGLGILGLGALLGLIVALQGGPFVFLMGIVGLLCAYFYSGSTRSLSTLVLGELVAFLVFGPFITVGSYLIQTSGVMDRGVLVYSLPIGLLAVAVVHANNMRDAEGDAHAGRRTIASILGLRWSRAVLVMLLLVAYGITITLALPKTGPHWLLLTLWTFPLLTIVVTGALRTDTPAGLHMVMRQLLRLDLYFGLLLSAGVLITALLTVLPHLPTRLLPF